MQRIFYQQDCNLAKLEGKTVAIIGYGSQGHAHALNLKESGVKVVVGLYKGSKSWEKAEKAGLPVMTAAEAAKAADVIMILINDEVQAKVYKSDIAPYLEDLKALSNAVLDTYGLHNEIKKVAKPLSKFKNLVVTADGISYAIAKEASLKIKETSYINVYSNILGEFMHGHVAVLNNHIAQIHISVDDLSYTAIKNLNKIQEDYNPPLCIIGNSNEKVAADYNVNIQCESWIVKIFCVVVIIQLLALEIAKCLHRNVDKPHGLHKVVK